MQNKTKKKFLKGVKATKIPRKPRKIIQKHYESGWNVLQGKKKEKNGKREGKPSRFWFINNWHNRRTTRNEGEVRRKIKIHSCTHAQIIRQMLHVCSCENHTGGGGVMFWDKWDENENKKEKKTNGINNGGHVNLPGGLYFGIWVLFWYLVLPFGRNPLHVQRGILCDRSFRPLYRKQFKEIRMNQRKINSWFITGNTAKNGKRNVKTKKTTLQLKTIFHYLTLDQHRHVHEHVVEFSNRVLQLDNVGVSSFDVGKCLFCLLCLHDDLLRGKIEVRMSFGLKEGVWHIICR